MAPDEIDVPHAIVRVLEEAVIQFVFGMPGGDTGRIFDALHDSREIQTVLVRHEQVGSIMAEMYGRLTGKPGVVMGQGIFLACNALFGALEAVKGASPMLLLGDFTDMAPFMHHAGLAGEPAVHLGHDRADLLVTDQDRLDLARVVQRIEDAARVAAGHAEDELDAGLLENLDERVRDGDLVGGHTRYFHSWREASFAPSAIDLNLAQAISGSTMLTDRANVAKPQSVPAITRSRPTTSA